LRLSDVARNEAELNPGGARGRVERIELTARLSGVSKYVRALAEPASGRFKTGVFTRADGVAA